MPLCYIRWRWIGLCLAAISGCESPSISLCAQGLYPDQSESAYVLPYAPGETFPVLQGNCSLPPRTHQSDSANAFAYDFAMPPGTAVTAARAGWVRRVVDHYRDDTGVAGEENTVIITHEDGTFGVYLHLQHQGGLVEPGQWVQQGQMIALSGNSGNSSGSHLHFHVLAVLDHDLDCDIRSPQCPVDCLDPAVACASRPVSFRNTAAHPHGLLEGRSYEAMAIDRPVGTPTSRFTESK